MKDDIENLNHVHIPGDCGSLSDPGGDFPFGSSSSVSVHFRSCSFSFFESAFERLHFSC